MEGDIIPRLVWGLFAAFASAGFGLINLVARLSDAPPNGRRALVIASWGADAAFGFVAGMAFTDVLIQVQLVNRLIDHDHWAASAFIGASASKIVPTIVNRLAELAKLYRGPR